MPHLKNGTARRRLYNFAEVSEYVRSRFEGMEALARERGLDFKELSLDDKDELWNEVKAAEPHEQLGNAVDFAAPRENPEA